MSQMTELFKPEALFSRENPFLKYAEKNHRLIVQSLDRAARLQLAFVEDLLDLNLKRIDAFYADDSLLDKVSAHQDLATEMGKRTANWAGDLQEVIVGLQSNFSDAANGLLTPAKKAPAGKAKKAKAA